MSLKKSIPYSQIQPAKRICPTKSEFERKVEQEEFLKRDYDSSSIEIEIKKIKLLVRNELLMPKKIQKAKVLPLTVTYNCIIPNIKQIIQTRWSILKINKALEKTFSIEPIIPFRKNISNNSLDEIP